VNNLALLLQAKSDLMGAPLFERALAISEALDAEELATTTSPSGFLQRGRCVGGSGVTGHSGVLLSAGLSIAAKKLTQVSGRGFFFDKATEPLGVEPAALLA
jgi:hypothetical protein